MSKRAKNVKRVGFQRQLPFVYWGMLVRYNGVFGNVIDGGGGGANFKIRLIGETDYQAKYYHPWSKGLEYLTERGEVIMDFKEPFDYKTQIEFYKSMGIKRIKGIEAV
jgi:hypothetical protein